jgi:ankyrin repeat protein
MAGTQQLLQLSVLLVAVQAFTSGFSNPLHDAAVNQDLVLLKQLLDSGKYDVNGLDANGRTPLAAAMATCSELLL